MKNLTMILALTLALAASLSWAQPEPVDNPPPPPGPGELLPPPGGPEGQPPPPVQLLMQHWKNNNPAEFERMKKLREDDPEAFREELHRKLEKAREERGFGRRGGPGGRGSPDGELLPPNPELQAAENKVRERVEAWRAADSEEGKAQARAALQDALRESFDLREQARRERLAQMEKKMNELRSSLEKRQQQRQAIIDKRLQELTEGDQLAW